LFAPGGVWIATRQLLRFLILIPRGGEHEVVHSPRGKAIPLETFLSKRDGVFDPGPKAVTLVCGQFNMDQHLALPALRALPADAASPAAKDWFSAVRSTHTARAPARIHEAPERAWTLEDLAQEAGMSRAAFARNFSASVGEPPHSYLTRWRMGIAAQLLEETDLRLSDIASRVGYRSEFSFSRAFKLARGVSPIQYRRATPSRSWRSQT
jgi:AraC family transcriptional activator of mtrCDE